MVVDSVVVSGSEVAEVEVVVTTVVGGKVGDVGRGGDVDGVVMVVEVGIEGEVWGGREVVEGAVVASVGTVEGVAEVTVVVTVVVCV